MEHAKDVHKTFGHPSDQFLHDKDCQLTFTCSKLPTETLEIKVKYVEI